MSKLDEFRALGRPIYVSITGLKPRSFLKVFLFWRHAIPSKMQADRAPGVLYVGVRNINGIQHTLTAWESKEHMRAYVSSGAHLRALRLFRKMATGATFGYEATALPSWDEVHELWKTRGKVY
jgi:hypothetical protein